MHKQKIITIGALWILLIVISWCTKNVVNTTENENLEIWKDISITDTTTMNENWDDTTEATDNEINTEEKQDTSNPTKDWIYEYESKLYNFSIQVPNQWNFVENEYGFSVIFYTPNDWGVRENLWISIQTPQINTNLEEYYQETMKKIEEISEWFNEIESTDIEVSWLKGKNTIYETIQNDTNIKSQQTVFIDNNIVYILQYTATKETFDKYIKEVNNIIKSFTLKN